MRAATYSDKHGGPRSPLAIGVLSVAEAVLAGLDSLFAWRVTVIQRFTVAFQCRSPSLMIGKSITASTSAGSCRHGSRSHRL
jgi:hypothetical protein